MEGSTGRGSGARFPRPGTRDANASAASTSGADTSFPCVVSPPPRWSPHTRPMNKRQRKKHHLGEFQELGFELRFCTIASWTDAEQLCFWDECIGRVEALGLSVGGETGTRWGVFVSGLAARTGVTAAQRQALLDWLTVHPAVSDVRAGPLEDAWHAHIPPHGAAA